MMMVVMMIMILKAVISYIWIGYSSFQLSTAMTFLQVCGQHNGNTFEEA
jgi:hypothetical protein